MNLNPAEIGAVAGAFLLFSFVPGVLGWLEALRQRREERVPPPVTVPPITVAAPAPAEPLAEAVAAPIDEPAVAAVDATVPEPLAPAAAAIAPTPDEGGHAFRLDDLRHARILETPARDVLDDPAAQRQWETGLRLAESHAAAIGGATLSASFEPQARCFAGMGERGDVKDVRIFLFADLWPTAVAQAVGEAVFEIGAAGIERAYVVRRG